MRTFPRISKKTERTPALSYRQGPGVETHPELHHGWSAFHVVPEGTVEDLRGIDPALDRDEKFTVPEEDRTAGETDLLLDLGLREPPGALRRARSAITACIDHPAFSAFSLSTADALELDAGTPDRVQDRRVPGDADDHVEGVEHNRY